MVSGCPPVEHTRVNLFALQALLQRREDARKAGALSDVGEARHSVAHAAQLQLAFHNHSVDVAPEVGDLRVRDGLATVVRGSCVTERKTVPYPAGPRVFVAEGAVPESVRHLSNASSRDPSAPQDKSSLRREAAYLPHVDKGSSSGLALGDFVLRLNRSELDLELIKELEGADDGPLESIPQLPHLRRQGRVRPGMVCHRVPVRRAARMPTEVVVAPPPLTVCVGACAMVRARDCAAQLTVDRSAYRASSYRCYLARGRYSARPSLGHGWRRREVRVPYAALQSTYAKQRAKASLLVKSHQMKQSKY